MRPVPVLIFLCTTLAGSGCLASRYHPPSQVDTTANRTHFPVASLPRTDPARPAPSRPGTEEQGEPPRSIPDGGPLPAESIKAPLRKLDSTPLDLDHVIAAAIANDPRLRADWEQVSQATGDFLTASLPRNPTLTVAQTLNPLTRPFTPERQGGPPQFDVWIGYPLDWFLFGKQAAAMATASAGIRVSQAEYADHIRKRVEEASLAYYDVLEAHARLEAAREDLEGLKTIEALYKKSPEALLKGKGELNFLPREILVSQTTLRQAEVQFNVAQAKLRALLGLGGGDAGIPLAGSLALPPEVSPISVEEAMVLAEQHRPDVQAQRERITHSQMSVHEEAKKARPELIGRIAYQRQFQTQAVGFPDANAWGVEVETTLPCFDRNQGNRLKAESQLVRNQHLLSAVLRDVRVELERVVTEHRGAYEAARFASSEQLKKAREQREAYLKGLEAGVHPLIDVLEAHRIHRELSQLFLSSRAGFHRATVRLHAAIGKQITP